MKFRLARLASMAVVAILATHAAPARANLILNGSFEDAPVPGSTGYLSFTPSSTPSLAGWTVVGNDVAVIGSSYTEGALQFNAHDGSYALDLTGVGNSGNSGTGNGIFQEVATIIGQQYNLSFLVGRMLSVPTDSRYNTTSTLNVGIDGGTPTSFTTDALTSLTGVANRVNYQLFNYFFVATGTTTKITFRNGTPPLPGGSNYVGLDDVQLTAVPEPATILSAGIAGLIGLGFAARRPRKARAA